MHQVVPALAALTFACLVGCGGASSLPSTAGTTAPPPTATTFSPTDTPSTTEPGATPRWLVSFAAWRRFSFLIVWEAGWVLGVER